MKRDFKVYIDDISDSITKIEKYTKKATKASFKKNTQLQDAVLRRLEIIGEAVKHIPTEIKREHPKTPWKQIAGARDIFAHEYFGVKLDRVWDTVKKDLPKLKDQVKEFLKED